MCMKPLYENCRAILKFMTERHSFERRSFSRERKVSAVCHCEERANALLKFHLWRFERFPYGNITQQQSKLGVIHIFDREHTMQKRSCSHQLTLKID